MTENKLNEEQLDKVSGGETFYHMVKEGEYLAGICMQYGVYDYGRVAQQNGISNCDNIHAGQIIKIIKY